MLADLTPLDVTGKAAATALDAALITVNKNAIPFDKQKPTVTSGIRLGTPAVTTRGMKEEEMVQIAAWIAQIVAKPNDEKLQRRIKQDVLALTEQFPVP
jgi:glycine hydroxymethyltransferase